MVLPEDQVRISRAVVTSTDHGAGWQKPAARAWGDPRLAMGGVTGMLLARRHAGSSSQRETILAYTIELSGET